jgi:hypothetical protein
LIDAGADVSMYPSYHNANSIYHAGVVARIEQAVAESGRRQHGALLNWMLAMAPLRLPIYIYLELFDWSIVRPSLREIEKIKVIQDVMDSYRRLKRARAVV